VLITGNVVHDNLLGIEVEIAPVRSDREPCIREHDGIFVDILPLPQRGTQEDTLVAFNSVRDNNRPNTAEPDELSASCARHRDAHRRRPRGHRVDERRAHNGFAGIAVSSLCLGLALQGIGCTGSAFDPDPVNDVSANRLIETGPSAGESVLSRRSGPI